MSDESPSRSAVSVPPVSNPAPDPAGPAPSAQKTASRKTLYLILGGVCVFLCACLCLVAAILGVYGLSRLSPGGGSAGGAGSHRASNSTWQVQVTTIDTSSAVVTDSSGGTASPKDGFRFIVVTAKIKNVSGKTQNFFLSPGNSSAGLKDGKGGEFPLAAVKKNGTRYINFSNQVQMLFIYSDEEDYEFYFVVPQDNRGPFTFTYMDLPPLGPLALP
jgi:hypothetical protein